MTGAGEWYILVNKLKSNNSYKDNTMIDWAALISRGYESKELDYKSAITWCEDDKKSCCELVKDILAIANHGGGWIIIGVSETAAVFTPKGVTEDKASTFETTRLNKFLNNYADPPINATIHKPVIQDKLFIGIAIPGFPDTPHICQKEYPGVLTAPTLYIRTDNNESAPIKTSTDFRLIVERGIKNRSNSLLESFRIILHGGSLKTQQTAKELFLKQVDTAREKGNKLNPHLSKEYAYRESAFYPSQFNEERFNLPELKNMALNAMDDLRGWPYIFFSRNRPELTYIDEDGYETFDAEQHVFSGGDTFHYWKLFQSGLLYTKEMLWDDTYASSQGIDFYVGHINVTLMCAQAVYCLSKLYEPFLDDSEEITLILKLIGVNNRKLITDVRGIVPIDFSDYTCHSNTITYEKSNTLLEWRVGLLDHILEICEYIFQRFNWENPNLITSKEFIEKMFQRKL